MPEALNKPPVPNATLGRQLLNLLQAMPKNDKAATGAVIHLLECGASLAERADGGDTALMHAAAGGHTGAVRALLKHGALVNETNGIGVTAVIRASARNHAEALQLLIDAGADVNAVKVMNETALHYAAAWTHPVIVDMLLKAGAKVDARSIHGHTPLMRCRGNIEIARLLLEAGADINAADAQGKTPHDHARECGAGHLLPLLDTFRNRAASDVRLKSDIDTLPPLRPKTRKPGGPAP